MAGIRIEAAAESDLYRVYLWLNRHRGETVTLEDGQTVLLGAPISGARSVLVAASVANGLGGVLRALATPDQREPVRMVFDIRSSAGLSPDQVRAIGAGALDSIARQIAEDDLLSQVA